VAQPFSSPAARKRARSGSRTAAHAFNAASFRGQLEK
jgi:hypothetical protein